MRSDLTAPLADLADLVAIDSVDPSLVAGGAGTGGGRTLLLCGHHDGCA